MSRKTEADVIGMMPCCGAPLINPIQHRLNCAYYVKPENAPPKILQFAEWITYTCLIFGCQVSTAFKVAGTLAEGLEKEKNVKEE